MFNIYIHVIYITYTHAHIHSHLKCTHNHLLSHSSGAECAVLRLRASAEREVRSAVVAFAQGISPPRLGSANCHIFLRMSSGPLVATL